MSTGGHLRRLGGEAVVYGIAGTIGRFLNVLLIPVYTRALTTSDYGVFGIALALLGLFTLVLSAMDNAAGRWFFDSPETADRQRVISSWFWIQLAIGAGGVLLSLPLARFVAATWMDDAGQAAVVVLVAAIACLSVPGKVLAYWLRLERRPLATMLFSLASTVVTSGLIIVFVTQLHRGVRGAFTAQLLAGALFALIATVLLRGWVAPARWSRQQARAIVMFSLPILPATVAAWGVTTADRLVLPFLLSSSEIGLYVLAFQLASVVSLVDAAFQMAWGPFSLGILNQPEADQVYARVFSLYGFLGSWLCTTIALFAPWVLALVSAPAYREAASSVPFLAFFFLAVGMTNVVGIGSLAVKNARPIAINIFIAALSGFALLFLLSPLLGRDGAALAKLTGMTLAVIYMYRACQKLRWIPYRVGGVIACIAFGWLLIAGASALVPDSGWAGALIRAVACLAFLPLAFALGLVDRDDVRTVWRRLRPAVPAATGGGA